MEPYCSNTGIFLRRKAKLAQIFDHYENRAYLPNLPLSKAKLAFACENQKN